MDKLIVSFFTSVVLTFTLIVSNAEVVDPYKKICRDNGHVPINPYFKDDVLCVTDSGYAYEPNLGD